MEITGIPYEHVRSICDHLVERSATLFLGAGVNVGIASPAGVTCPLGSELSDWICRDLLRSPETVVPLDEAAEMARHAFGERAFNEYLFKEFEQFQPGAVHLGLVQLPWDKIFTTNFDLLIERAAESGKVQPAGYIRAIGNTTTDVSVLAEEDIPYFKLHGSIDMANTEAGRLILTKKDYREYEKFKKPLFKRLKADLESRTFLFLGYSLSDTNFRSVLDDCREELGAQTLPRSYAVIKHFTSLQQQYWREKYNIELIQADATEFVETLRQTWISEGCTVIPLLQRKAAEYFQLGTQTRFQKIGDSFYLLRTTDCTGKSDPKRFFLGAEPSWADIRDKVPARRDLYEPLIEAMFPELVDVRSDASAYVIIGPAGTGKTTLLYTLAYDLVADFQAGVLIHIPGTPLDTRIVAPLITEDDPRRFVVVVRYSSEQIRELAMFYNESRNKKLPITLLLEDRTNQWHVAQSTFATQFSPPEFELRSLSAQEIDGVLDTLTTHGCLGKLTGITRDEQVSHFNDLASEDLLVALRELTSEGDFDKIIRDEYSKIPSPIAQRAYLYVAAVGQLDLAMRYETIFRILEIGPNELASNLLNPAEGILITGEDTGSSRHNIGFRLRARHPIIASIIFALAAEDDSKKFGVINEILSELDPGFPEDIRLIRQVMQRKELISTLASDAMRRAVFERLEALLPGDPYVWQHRSILERDLGNAEDAVRFARMALKANPSNITFANALGFALELSGRNSDDSLKKQAFQSEATKLFEEGIKRAPTDPYNYIGQFAIMRQKAEAEKDPKKRSVLVASSLSLLSEAFEETNESEMIAGELAKVKKQLGSIDEGIQIIKQALAKKPGDTRLRDLLIRFLNDKGEHEEALKVAIESAKLDPTSWRMQRWLARLRQQGQEVVNAVKGNYEAAIRHHKGDVGLMVEYGAYLFRKLLLDEASAIFQELQRMSMSSQERRMIREKWMGQDGSPSVFTGTIEQFNGARGSILAVPENFRAHFWRDSRRMANQKEGSTVRFNVGFNAQGAEAKILPVRISEKLAPR